MSSNLIVFLEFLLVSGLLLGFAVWQVVSLEREKKSAEAESKDAKADPSR